MKSSERRLIRVALLLLDAITVTLALGLAYYIRIGSGWIPYLSEVDLGAYERSMWVAVPLWLLISAFMRLYQPQSLLGGPARIRPGVQGLLVQRAGPGDHHLLEP